LPALGECACKLQGWTNHAGLCYNIVFAAE
jgi:hypothetical protein